MPDPTADDVPANGTRRRAFLGTAAVLAAGGMAGCGLAKSDDSKADDGSDKGSPAQGTSNDGISMLSRIKADKKIRFGVDLSFKPLQYRDEKTKEPTGYSIEVAKLLAEALGAEPEWVEVPFQEIISAQKANRFDMAGIPVVNTAVRALEVAFAAAPAFLEGTYLFQRKGLGISSQEQLNDSGITIAILAGSAQSISAKLLFPKAKLKELPDDVAATADVRTKRSDVLFVGDYAVGDATSKGLELHRGQAGLDGVEHVLHAAGRDADERVRDDLPAEQGGGPLAGQPVAEVRRERDREVRCALRARPDPYLSAAYAS